MWSTLGCHWSARLTPFKVASSSARFMSCIIFLPKLTSIFHDGTINLKGNSHGQWAGIHPNGEFILVDAPISSHWIIPSHSTHGFGQHASQGSIWHFIVPSWHHGGCMSFYSRHHHSEPPAYGKWPISFPHAEKVLRRVMTSGTSRASPPLLQRSFSQLPLTCNPSTFAPFWRGSGSLHVNLKCLKCFLTAWEDTMHSLTKTSSM